MIFEVVLITVATARFSIVSEQQNKSIVELKQKMIPGTKMSAAGRRTEATGPRWRRPSKRRPEMLCSPQFVAL